MLFLTPLNNAGNVDEVIWRIDGFTWSLLSLSSLIFSIFCSCFHLLFLHLTMPSFSLLFHCFFLFLCLLLSNPLTPTLHSPQSSHSFLLYSSLIPSVFTVINLSFSVSFVLHFPFMTHTTFIATLFSPHKYMTLLHIFLFLPVFCIFISFSTSSKRPHPISSFNLPSSSLASLLSPSLSSFLSYPFPSTVMKHFTLTVSHSFAP